MIGRRRQSRGPSRTVSRILDLIDYAQVPQYISVTNEIEHEIRLRPNPPLPRLIDVESLKALVDGHETEYVKTTDTTTSNRVRTTTRDGQEVERIFKERVTSDDSVVLPDWNVRVTTSIEYDMNHPDAYNYLNIDRREGEVVILRTKERLSVYIGVCILSITQIRSEIRGEYRPPVVEFEIEVGHSADRQSRERCLSQSLELLDRIAGRIRGLQNVVSRWLGSEWRGQFFGSLPVSYRNRQASIVKSNKYFVQAKIDGIRRIMVNLPDGVWFIDRTRGIVASTLDPLQNMEYMIDTEYVDSPSGLYVVAFDMLAEDNVSIMDMNYSDRYNRLLALIDRLEDLDEGQEYLTINTTIPSQDIDELVSLVRGERYDLFEDGTYEFNTDGFVLQHDGPYVSGVDPNVFKWKYPNLLTIDYMIGEQGLSIQTPTGPSMFIGGSWSEYPVGTIVEFGYDKNSSEWVPQRVRDDKLVPNFMTTVADTMESMIENVNLHQLTSAIR